MAAQQRQELAARLAAQLPSTRNTLTDGARIDEFMLQATEAQHEPRQPRFTAAPSVAKDAEELAKLPLFRSPTRPTPYRAAEARSKDLWSPVFASRHFEKVGRLRADNILRQIEKEEVERARAQRHIDEFRAGDAIAVKLYATALGKPKYRLFAGICLARRKMDTTGASFLLRMVMADTAVEMIFPLHSPWIVSVHRVREGRINKRKAYYLRREKLDFFRVVVPDALKAGCVYVE